MDFQPSDTGSVACEFNMKSAHPQLLLDII